MELFSKKLQFHKNKLLTLTCVLLLVFSLGASLARAEEEEKPETAVTGTEAEPVPEQEDASTDAEPELISEQEAVTADTESESILEQKAASADAEPEQNEVPEADTSDAEPEAVEEPEEELTDAELERLRLSQCVFTIEEGEIYWMSLTEEELAEYAAYLQKELNLNTAAVAGILTNIQFESGFNPNKVGDGGAAYGICQWRGARLDQMVEFCDENGLNPISLEGQFAFLVHDLQNNYIYPYDLVRLVHNSPDGATDATFYFCAYYEVPSDPDTVSADRVEYCDILFYPALLDLEED